MIEVQWLDEFRNPSATYRQSMFWIWNGELTEERITEMLEGFAEVGIGGGFAHARTGRITPYMSARWLEVWQHTLREARRLGLEVHIYDEDGFPSGPAGGRTLEQCPDAGHQWLRTDLHREPPVEFDGDLVGAWRYDEGSGVLTPLAADANLDQAARGGAVLTASWLKGGRGVDLYRPEVTQAFIRVTHDVYAEHSQGYLGSECKYVFTDEPGIHADRGLPICEYLLREFKADHGYDLLDRLEAMWADTDDAPAVRYDYHETMNRLWVDNFVKAVFEWCEPHGLGFTGHFWEHNWPYPNGHPNSMWCYRWMQVPGVDVLGFQWTPEGRRAGGRGGRGRPNTKALMNCKEAASVRNQLGRSRVLSENYGGGGYEMALPEFKGLSDWAAVYGVNLNCPHLSYETLAGRRKYDWPQTISDHASWWPCYHALANHDARLVFALCQGSELNRVLVLNPTATGWLHYVPEAHELGENVAHAKERLDALRESFCRLADALDSAHVDFDLGDEWIMEEFGGVEDGRLRVGERLYDVVVLPQGMETWRESTVALMRQYLQSGGRLRALGEPPRYVRGRPQDAPAALAQQFAGGWTAVQSVRELVSELTAMLPPRVSAADGGPLPQELLYRREELGDGQVLHYFANPWREGVVATRVRVEGQALAELDTMSGQMRPLASQFDGDAQVAELTLHPSGHALWISDPDRSRAAALPPPPQTVPVEADIARAERLEPNLLVIDYCDLRIGGREFPSMNTTRADQMCQAAFGHQGRRHFVEFEAEQALPPEEGIRLDYAFTTDGADLSALELAVERPWLYRVEVNGTEVTFPEDAQWWDEDVRRIGIGELAEEGRNVVSMTAAVYDPLCEVMPIYVLGEFAVEDASPGFVLTQPAGLGPGDWRQMGLRFYPWAVRYEVPIRLQEPARGLTVRVPDWAGSAVRVVLDGADAGVIAWPPYELKVEGELAAGEHTLAVDVFGNMKNMMGPFFDDGLPGVWTWMIHPDHEPDGSEYRFFECGLRAAPSVEAWR